MRAGRSGGPHCRYSARPLVVLEKEGGASFTCCSLGQPTGGQVECDSGGGVLLWYGMVEKNFKIFPNKGREKNAIFSRC
jgi:hypothetical protein